MHDTIAEFAISETISGLYCQCFEHRWPESLPRLTGLQDVQGRYGPDDPLRGAGGGWPGRQSQLRQPWGDRDGNIPQERDE